MTLGQLKQHIESFPAGTVFGHILSNPFSWRGDYSEVAFSISTGEATREELLSRIEKAFNETTFYGYKGGEYEFEEHTNIHFEEAVSSWTDGEYCAKKLNEITGNGEATIEGMLVKAAFK